MCKSQVKYNRMIRSLVGMIELILVLRAYRCACCVAAGCGVSMLGSLNAIDIPPIGINAIGYARCAMVGHMFYVFSG